MEKTCIVCLMADKNISAEQACLATLSSLIILEEYGVGAFVCSTHQYQLEHVSSFARNHLQKKE